MKLSFIQDSADFVSIAFVRISAVATSPRIRCLNNQTFTAVFVINTHLANRKAINDFVKRVYFAHFNRILVIKASLGHRPLYANPE